MEDQKLEKIEAVHRHCQSFLVPQKNAKHVSSSHDCDMRLLSKRLSNENGNRLCITRDGMNWNTGSDLVYRDAAFCNFTW